MRTNFCSLLFLIMCNLVLAQECVELSDASISQMIEADCHVDIGDLKNKASEWAEQCLNGLSVEDRATICAMLECSYKFSYTNLRLRRATRIVFDISCSIQDKLHNFAGITEETVLLKKIAVIVDELTQEYNKNLESWQQYASQTNQEQRTEILDALKQADLFTQAFVDEYIKIHSKQLCDGLEDAVVDNLKQHALIKTIYSSLAEQLFKSKIVVSADSANILEDLFLSARLHFNADVKAVWKMRRFFVLEEIFLELRKDISKLFYDATLAYKGQGI